MFSMHSCLLNANEEKLMRILGSTDLCQFLSFQDRIFNDEFETGLLKFYAESSDQRE
jgi:hypothetical protein